MIKHIKRIIKDSVVYGLGQSLNQAAGFILIPIYVHYLSPEQYGLLAILTALISLINIFTNVGQTSALLRYYYGEITTHQRKEIYTASIVIVFTATLIIEFFFFYFRQDISHYFLKSNEYAKYLVLIIIITFLNSFSLIPLTLLRAERRVISYIIFSFLQFITYLTFNIIFVIYLKQGVEGVLHGYLFSNLIFCILLFLFNIRNISFRFSRKINSDLLKFGLPFLPTQLSDWILNLADRLIMTQLVTFSIIGIYNLGYKIGFLVNLFIIVPFQLAWGPFMFQMEKEKDAIYIYANTFKLILFFGTITATAVSLFASEIISVIAPNEYQPAHNVVPLVSFAYVLLGCYYTFTTGLNLRNKTYYFPLTVGIPAIINIVGNYFIIPHFPLTGAAYTTLLSYFIMAGLTLYFSQKFYFIPFPLFTASILFLIALGISIGHHLIGLNHLNIFPRIVMKILLIVGIFILANVLNIISLSRSKQYLSHLKGFLNK